MAFNKRLINTGGAAACSTDSTDPFGDSSGVALYSLDYDASDAGGYYDGTPTDVDFGVDGQINYGARFNGSSSRIALPKLTGLTADVSVSGWVNLGNTTTSNRIRFIEINTDANGYAGTLSIYYKPSNGEWQARSGNGTSSNSNVLTHTYTLTQSTWYHVCFTRDDSTNVTKFYINGSLQDTETVSVSSSYPSGATGVIGDLNYSSGLNYNWLGEIDQVRIFSKALDETTNGEVSALYAETACVYTSTTDIVGYPTSASSDIVAYYKMDNSSEDFKGSNDGTDTNIEYRFGRFGQAAVFNGSSRIGTGITSFTNNLAISMWLNPSSLHSNGNWVFANWNSTTEDFYFYVNSSGQIILNFDGQSGGEFTVGSAGDFSVGNWTHFAVSMNSGSYEVYINGNSVGTNSTTNTTFNNGQDFEIGNAPKSSSVPSWNGLIDQVRIYDAALTSSQVTELYNEKPEVDTSNFKAVLYTGNGGSQYISNVGFEPDLVWAKARNNTHPHILFDSVRGENRQISSNETSAEIVRASDAYLFDKNGFTVTTAGNSNNSGFNYVAWNWKGGGDDVLNEQGSTDSQVSANTAAGFSIVKYTGAGDVNVGHGLLAPPNLIISKITNVGGSWVVYNSISGTGKYLVLNDTASIATASEVFSAVTGSTFTHNWSGNSYSYIAYCFHSAAGYSKIGSYNGTSSTGNRIYVDSNNDGTGTGGFEPSFVMLKKTNGTGNWFIYDNKRPNTNYLRPDLSNARGTDGGVVFTSDGFTINVTYSDHNISGGTYLYMAFK